MAIVGVHNAGASTSRDFTTDFVLSAVESGRSSGYSGGAGHCVEDVVTLKELECLGYVRG